jgi:DNA-binding MarR family transcriptional regulator
MTTPRQAAALVMDNIPLLMRLLRSKFREKQTGELSMAQFRTLAFVDANQGASLSDAAGTIGLGLPSMSKQVNILVNRKLITRVMDDTDRRRVCLAMTAKGTSVLAEAYQHTQDFFANKFETLTEDERVQIAMAINTMQVLFDLNPTFGSEPADK